MQVLILAGGLGTRLRSIVSDRPKCMALIMGKPFLEYQIRYLRSQGFSNFIICSGYKHQQISEYFEDGRKFSVRIDYSIEKEPLGTGGAIKNAFNLLENRFIVVNGDTLVNFQYDSLLKFHNINNADITMVIAKVNHNSRYGSVLTDLGNRIITFSEKTHNSVDSFINTGIYLIDKNSINWKSLPLKFSLETNLFPSLVSKNNFFGLRFNGYLIDIGIPEDFIRFQQEIKSCKWLFTKDFNI